MTSRAWVIALGFGLVLVLAAASPPSATGPAFVKVVSLTPTPGATVDAGTVLKAEVEYHIQVFDPKTTHYVLAPMFALADGRGTFNHLNRTMDGKVLRAAEGTVKITYPIRHELADSRLAKPVQCFFTLLQVKGNVILPVVSSDPVTYEVK